MSGESLDDVFAKVRDAAYEIKQRVGNDIMLLSFAKFLDSIGTALHDVALFLSGDIGRDDLASVEKLLPPLVEVEVIKEFLDELENEIMAIRSKIKNES